MIVCAYKWIDRYIHAHHNAHVNRGSHKLLQQQFVTVGIFIRSNKIYIQTRYSEVLRGSDTIITKYSIELPPHEKQQEFKTFVSLKESKWYNFLIELSMKSARNQVVLRQQSVHYMYTTY